MQVNHFKYTSDFSLESGETLKGFTLEYCTFGKLNEDQSNVIWVCHALTGNAKVTDWWDGLFGDNYFYKPDEHFVVCANVLGSCYGSTGPLSLNPETNEPYFHQFPTITIKDIVNSLQLLKSALGINKIHTLLGGSLGGQQALEWAVQFPDDMEHLIIMASNAKHSPWGIAFNEAQRLAIESDPTWQNNTENAGENGLIAARAVAMLSYRNYQTYECTQNETDSNKIDNFKASSYQKYQGEKLTQRFNAYSYYTLSKTMDSHNIGRGWDSLEEALNNISAITKIIGISTDVLFPPEEQRFISKHIKNAEYEEISSSYGHDGFLVETQKLEASIASFYAQKDQTQLIYDERN